MILNSQNSDRWAYDISRNVVSKGEIYDVAVINQSIENILTTIPGERIFNLSFGSSLMLRVFEIASKKNGEELLNDVVKTIQFWDNRIKIIESEMRLVIDEDNNSALIEIPYRIKTSGLKGVFQKKIIN
jgi:phage baseplate assembly protein W